MGGTVAIRLFGPVSVVAPSGRAVPVGGTRPRAVLAMLALHAGRPVTVPAIVGGVWGDEPPATVGNTIQVHISALRRAIRAAGLDIARDGQTYTLVASLDDVDSSRFERLGAEGRASLLSGELARAGALLSAALALRGAPPLAGLDDCRFVEPARAALDATFLAVSFDHGAALCGLGRADEAVGFGEQLVAQHPFHEGAWESLITSLYHAGRSADALAAFTRMRDVMREELGLDPSPHMVALELAVLDHSVPPPLKEPPAVAEVPRLPTTPGDLVGRDALVAEVVHRLGGRSRLVTLVGLGGIGKTSVALAAGRSRVLSADVVFADLVSSTTATAALEVMCRALGVEPGDDPVAAIAQAPTGRVVIADNAEQVVGLGPVLAQVLRAGAGLRVLVTSRVPMRIRGEQVIVVPPLPVRGDGAGGVELFRRRADLENLDDGVASEICELLGGLPLAIEIAAARAAALTPRRLLTQLRSRRQALLDASGAADLPGRQRSLRIVLDATVGALDAPAAELMWRMAPVSGPLSAALIEHLCGDELDMITALDVLVLAGVVVGPDDDERYRMPVPVADYARDPSHGRDLASDINRVVIGVREMLEPLVDAVGDDGAWAESQLVADEASVTLTVGAVLDDGDPDAISRLFSGLRRYWLVAGRIGEARRATDAALRLPLDDRSRAGVLLLAGQAASWVDHPDAPDLLTSGLDLTDRVGGVPDALVVNGWCYLGSWRCRRLDAEEGRRCAIRAADVATASGDTRLIDMAADFAAMAANYAGDFEGALELCLEGAARARRRGDVYAVIDALQRAAENLIQLDRAGEADVLLDEAFRLSSTIAIGPLATALLIQRAICEVALGRLASAVGTAREVLRRFRSGDDDPVMAGVALRVLACVESELGHAERASRLDGAATELLAMASMPSDSMWSAPLSAIAARLRAAPGHNINAAVGAADPARVIEEAVDEGRAVAAPP